MSRPPARPTIGHGWRTPQGRYRVASRRPVIWLAAAVAALLAALLVLWAVLLASPAVSSGVLGYRVLSPHAVRIEFVVRAGAGTTALCTVRARDLAGAEVGRAVLRVAPDRSGSRTVTTTLRTSSLAIGGELVGCTAAG